MTFIWRTTAGAKNYIPIRQNQFLASNGKRAWLSLNVTLCVFFKSILFFYQTTAHGKQSLLSLTGSSYFSKACLPNASPSAVRQAILMWRSAVTVDRQTATVWRTTDGQ